MYKNQLEQYYYTTLLECSNLILELDYIEQWLEYFLTNP